MVDKIKEYYYESDKEKPWLYSEDGQMKKNQNLDLNECLSSVVSDVICEITIQNINYILVSKYETILNKLEVG